MRPVNRKDIDAMTEYSNIVSRKNIRLKNWDYSEDGVYFITVCTKQKQNILGDIRNEELVLSGLGKIVRECILRINEIYQGVSVDCYVVMPNHVHMILSMTRDMGKAISIPHIIQQWKAAAVRLTKRDGRHAMPPLQWQRGYYDHIVRNEASYREIYEYIETNPQKWLEDKYFENL